MNVLFMCVANSARSQMAEGLAREILKDVARVESAGSFPKKINFYAVRVMMEIGIDITGHFSKGVPELSGAFLGGLEYVITLCQEEVCPTYISATVKTLHWPIPDPATDHELSDVEMLTRFRSARDTIKAKLENFKREIAP